MILVSRFYLIKIYTEKWKIDSDVKRKQYK